jgi:hypothetical protein
LRKPGVGHGVPTGTTLPTANGYLETRTYDRAGRLAELKNAKGASVLSDFAYTRDPAAGRAFARFLIHLRVRADQPGPGPEFPNSCSG